MTNVFALSAELSTAYLDLKFGTVTKAACKVVVDQAACVLTSIKAAKNEVYASGPKVFGSLEFSRLDLLDQWEMKACAVYDNATDMMVKAGASAP